MRSGILFRNEFIKTRRRAAFWVASLVFSGLMSLIFGSMFSEGLRKPERAMTLPGAWGEVVGGPGVLGAFFASIVLILLVSSEFTWRTSRQNVIDGLSKEEFFGAKLFLLPGVGLFFFAALLLFGGGFALAGTVAKGTMATSGPLVRSVDVALMGGAFVGLLGWASLAFLLAITIRSAGSAIGAFFLYFIVEQVLGGFAGSLGPTAAQVARFAPNAVFKALWEPVRFGVVALKPGQSLGIATNWYLLAGAAYIVVFVSAAFILYRRRDL
jgi:ABC-2 type transport system permease protein